jgi:hypothetical protein
MKEREKIGLKNLGGDKKMKKKIVAGTVIALFLIVIAGIALVVSSTQRYPEASEAAEVEGEGYWYGGKTIDSPSDSGIRGYLTGVIEDYRSGQSNCQGGTGDWQDTRPCLENAIIRWSGESQYAPAFEDDIEQCYWRWSWLVPTEHCYPDWDGGSQDDPVYYTYIGNPDRGFYHAVCAEYEGGSTSDFANWRFFQYRDNNIEPGDSQMPCGTDTDDTYVLVQSTYAVECDDMYATTIHHWNIDSNCAVTYVRTYAVQVTDEDVARIKSEIEKLREEPAMQIGGTSTDLALKTVTLWVRERTPENQQLHGKKIDGWKFVVAESPKPSEDIEVTAEMIRGVIEELRKVPEMQIGGTSTDSALKTVTLWVNERTPENQRLHHEMIGGWKIIIAEDQTSDMDIELTAEMIADGMEGLEKMPEMQIAEWEINETEKTAIIWVYELTPENQHLGDEDTGEWKINVREVPKPPE